MYIPCDNANSAVNPSDAVEVANARMYFGASFAWKTFPKINLAALAIPTIAPVRTTRLFSEIEWFEYQVERRTESVLEPIQRGNRQIKRLR